MSNTRNKLPYRYYIMNICESTSYDSGSDDDDDTDTFMILKTDATGKQISLRSSSDPIKDLKLTKKAEKWDLNAFQEITKEKANDLLKVAYGKSKK